MFKNFTLVLFIIFSLSFLDGQSLESIQLTEKWKNEIYDLSPDKSLVDAPKKKMLIFSLHTGFEHWTIPHTEYVIKTLGEKSGAYEVMTSKNISSFNPEYLKEFDVVVLNNTCSKGDHRNIFFDVLREDSSLTEEQARGLAQIYEQNLLEYVATGGGLAIMHGGIVMQNNSIKFGRMIGGSFYYHPPQQKIDIKLADPQHPILEAFDGEGFTHVDEPYFFNGAYSDFNFRPLLYMETSQLEKLKYEEEKEEKKYVAWIKSYGLGKVFYSSPSHNAQSFSNPKLLKFLLNGLQYASGDLECDDAPIGRAR